MEGTEAGREKVTGEGMMMSDYVNDRKGMRFRTTRDIKEEKIHLINHHFLVLNMITGVALVASGFKALINAMSLV